MRVPTARPETLRGGPSAIKKQAHCAIFPPAANPAYGRQAHLKRLHSFFLSPEKVFR